MAAQSTTDLNLTNKAYRCATRSGLGEPSGFALELHLTRCVYPMSKPDRSDSMEMLTHYIEAALTFEHLAEIETNGDFRSELEAQAATYRRLAARKAEEL